jgi:acyl carrier protein
METAQIELRLKKLFLEKDVSASQLTKDAHLETDLGLDSLDLAELIMDIEREFDISISENDWGRVNTYHALSQYIAAKVQKRSPAI